MDLAMCISSGLIMHQRYSFKKQMIRRLWALRSVQYIGVTSILCYVSLILFSKADPPNENRIYNHNRFLRL